MDEEFDPSVLPVNVVPVSKPSQAIERLLSKRKAEHERILELLQRRKQEIHYETDEAIHYQTNQVNAKIQAIKSEMEIYLSDIKNKFEKPMEIDSISSQSVLDMIENAKQKLQDVVQQHNSFLVRTEQNRTENIKLIFRECYDELSNIAFISALELDKMFEADILASNQLTLHNYESYAEQIKHYELEVESNTKLWSSRIDDFKEDLKDIYKRLHNQRIGKLKSSLQVDLKTISVRDIKEEIKKIKSYHSQMVSNESLLPVEPEEVETWLKDVQKMLASLDQSAGRIVGYYKDMTMLLFNRFFEELEDLKAMMCRTGIIDKADIEDFQSEMYTPGVEQLNVTVRRDLQKLQDGWQEAINNMKESVTETYNFLKTAAHIWDRHFQRIENCQLLILQDLTNTLESNNRHLDCFEATMNLLIDKLRLSPDERKLHSNYMNAIAHLDDKVKVYSINRTGETSIMQKYKSLMEIEIEVLTSELKRFLILNPPDEEKDPKKQRKRASQISDIELDLNETYIPPQIIYCIFHAGACKNWMFGLWESVNQYVGVCRTEILAAADEWMSKQTTKVKERYEVRSAFHKPRYERLKYSIYLPRQNELRRHSNRLESHRMAAVNEVQFFKTSNAIEFKKCSIAVENVRNEAEKLYKLSEDSQSSHQVKNLILNLNVYAKKETSKIDEICNILKETYLEFLERLTISNYLFLSCVRLFSENGNYCSEELDVLNRNLTRLKGNAVKQIADLVGKTEVRMKIHKNQIEEILTENCRNMQEIINEHTNQEKSFRTIISLRDSIIKEIVDIQVKLKNIQNKSVTLIGEAIEKVGVFEYAEKFADEIQQISNTIGEFVRNLEHPSPVICYSNVEHKTSFAEKLQEKTNRNRRTYPGKSIFLLPLESIATESVHDNFMRNVIRLVYQTIDKLDKEGREFYSKHPKVILDQSKTQQTYNEFVEEMTINSKNLLQQAEVFWTELAGECVATLKELQHFKERYFTTFINTFNNSKRDGITTVNELIQMELVKQEKRTKNDIREMYNKLRVLYGHPKNRNILQELEIEFEEFLNMNMEAKITEIVNPLKEMLVTAVDQAVSEKEKVTEIFKIQKEENQLRNNIELLNEQLEIKRKIMDSSLKNEPVSSVSVQHTGRKSLDLRILRDKLLFNTSDIEKLTSLSHSSMNSTSTFEDENIFLKDISQLKEEYLENIDKFTENKLLFHIKNFKDVWANEIRSILDLYRVKYDKKDIF